MLILVCGYAYWNTIYLLPFSSESRLICTAKTTSSNRQPSPGMMVVKISMLPWTGPAGFGRCQCVRWLDVFSPCGHGRHGAAYPATRACLTCGALRSIERALACAHSSRSSIAYFCQPCAFISLIRVISSKHHIPMATTLLLFLCLPPLRYLSVLHP